MVQAGSGNRNNDSSLSITNIASHEVLERAIRSIIDDLIDDAILGKK